jgi:hypothetical protein
METSSDPHALVGADRPFFTSKESLDDITWLSSVSFARGDLSIGRYRRDRSGLGISTPNPISPPPVEWPTCTACLRSRCAVSAARSSA